MSSPFEVYMEDQDFVREISLSFFRHKALRGARKWHHSTGYETLLYIGTTWISLKNTDVHLSPLDILKKCLNERERKRDRV